MTDLPFRKLYIDTRFKTADSASNSDFSFQLGRTAFMNIGTTFCIDEINIPYAWNTIEAGVNDKLYIGWQITPSSQLGYTILTVPPKRYGGTDLAAQIQSQLNSTGSILWAVSYDYTLNTITFSATSVNVFKIFTDGDIALTTAFAIPDRLNPQSINEILQIAGASSGYYNSPSAPFTTGFLNLLNYQDLYLTSATLGSFDSLGTRGESSIIRKICVNAAWGFSIIDKLSSDWDSMTCSKRSLATIDFQLRDVKGRIVPLHGAHVSFTIRFKNE